MLADLHCISPMRSALSSERSSSSRLGKVRKISEEGKGECRNTPARMRLNRLRSRDGSTCRGQERLDHG